MIDTLWHEHIATSYICSYILAYLVDSLQIKLSFATHLATPGLKTRLLQPFLFYNGSPSYSVVYNA